jgi:hypothetical protein
MLTQPNVLANLCSCVYTRTVTPGVAHARPLSMPAIAATFQNHATIESLSLCFY